MRFNFGHNDVCTYCGDHATCLDHTIPYSYFRNTGGHYRRSEAIGFLTPACDECNTILGDRIFTTFQERFKFVHDRLVKKYKKKLGIIWDKEDLKGVSGRLKQYIEQQNRINQRIQTRLNWPSSVEFSEIMNEAYSLLYYSSDVPKEWKTFLIDEEFEPI